MGARTKLNSIYLGGAAVIAGTVGLLTKSILASVACLAGLTAAMFHDGSVRVKPQSNHKFKRRTGN